MTRAVGVEMDEEEEQEPEQIIKEAKANKKEKPINKISKIQKKETLRLNIGSLTVDAAVIAMKQDLLKLKLREPSCIIEKSKISISRKMGKIPRWRLIGLGILQGGKEITPSYVSI